MAPPDPALLQTAGVKSAAPSVVRVLGSACGLEIAGSAWGARPELVVTTAHVVAGEKDTSVEIEGSNVCRHAIPAAFGSRSDIAVPRVPGLALRPLRAVTILGYAESGQLSVVAGRLGTTTVVLSEDACGHGPVRWQITSVSGEVRHADSGGPTVDATGAVGATIVAALLGALGGFGVPSSVVNKILSHISRRGVSTRACSG